MIDWDEYPLIREQMGRLRADFAAEEFKMMERKERILAGGYDRSGHLLDVLYDQFHDTVAPLRAHLDHLVRAVADIEAMKPPAPIVITLEQAQAFGGR